MKENNNSVIYRLTVTEKQLRLINTALEEYFRLGANQWWPLAERLAAMNFDLSTENPDHDKSFDRFMHTRDAVGAVFEAAGRIMWPDGLERLTADNIIAQDMWQVIRHQLWMDDPNPNKSVFCCDANTPCLNSQEPVVKCEKVQTKEGD